MTHSHPAADANPSRRPSLTAAMARSRLLVGALAMTVVIGASGVSGAGMAVASDSAFAGMPVPEAMAAPTTRSDATASVTDALYQMSRTTIRFRAGRYTFYRFSDRGTLLRSRDVRFAWAVRYRAAANPVMIGNRWFTKIRGGAWMGWHVATPAATPTSVTTFERPKDVQLGATSHTGLRFYANGRITTRRIARLSSPETVQATKRGTFGTREFFFLASGALADRWVPVSSFTTSSGSGDVTAPDSGPVNDTSAAVIWKTLVLVYRETDVTFTRANGSRYRLQARMSDYMYDLALDTVRRTVGTANAWSGRMAALNMEIIDVPHALTAVEPLGDGYWVGPDSVKPDLDRYAPTGRYDSIVVIFQPKDADGVYLPVPGWGLTLPPGPWANGAGYSSVKTPLENWWWTNATYPEEVFIHEWMHQVLFFHESKLDLHASAQYGYEQVNGTWKQWLSAVMQGTVRSGDRMLGVNQQIWQSGTPTRP